MSHCSLLGVGVGVVETFDLWIAFYCALHSLVFCPLHKVVSLIIGLGTKETQHKSAILQNRMRSQLAFVT